MIVASALLSHRKGKAVGSDTGRLTHRHAADQVGQVNWHDRNSGSDQGSRLFQLPLDEAQVHEDRCYGLFDKAE